MPFIPLGLETSMNKGLYIPLAINFENFARHAFTYKKDEKSGHFFNRLVFCVSIVHRLALPDLSLFSPHPAP